MSAGPEKVIRDEIRALTAYQATVRSLSDRLVQALRPIRILDAVRWDDSIEDAFFAGGARSLPRVGSACRLTAAPFRA